MPPEVKVKSFHHINVRWSSSRSDSFLHLSLAALHPSHDVYTTLERKWTYSTMLTPNRSAFWIPPLVLCIWVHSVYSGMKNEIISPCKRRMNPSQSSLLIPFLEALHFSSLRKKSDVIPPCKRRMNPKLIQYIHSFSCTSAFECQSVYKTLERKVM